MSSPSSSSSSFSSVYSLGPSLGRGNYGSVHLATDVHSALRYAAKLTPCNSGGPPDEHVLYHHLHHPSPLPGVPRAHFTGRVQLSGKLFDALVLDKLGPSLQTLLSRRRAGRVHARDALELGTRMAAILRGVHERGVVHCDVKPDNWLVDDAGDVWLVDFGLGKWWRDAHGRHVRVAYGSKREAVGMFASGNWHQGVRWARRDDMEMLLYVLAYVKLGSLPWMKEDVPRMAEMKLKGTGWDVVDKELDRVRMLRYEQRPDYEGMIERWHRALRRENRRRDARERERKRERRRSDARVAAKELHRAARSRARAVLSW